jgi:nitrogen fixation-related uncharacterized protein
MKIITVISLVVVFIGIGVSVWSYKSTREKYYKEYLEKKRKK